MSEQVIIIALTVVLALLQIGDWYTTRTILKHGGIELNPIMRKVFEYVHVDVALALKSIFVTGVITWACYLPLSIFSVLLYAFVVLHNWKQLK